MRYGTTAAVAYAGVVTSLLCWSSTAPAAVAYRILAYEPSPGHSHWNVMSAVLESLVDAGHEVVCATMHPATDRLAGHPNYTHVDLSDAVGQVSRFGKARDLNYERVMKMFKSNTFVVGIATTSMRKMCRLLSDVPEMRDILSDSAGAAGGQRRRFDAVVMESLHSECQSELPGRLSVPTVYVVPSLPVNWMPTATGSPDHPSYMGALLADRPTPGTFVQRLANAAIHVHTNLVRWYNDAGGTEWPTPRDTMVFVNTHHSVEPARPLGPNVLEIGGVHLRPPEPLPRDLTDMMDKSSEHGVIVFSFGSLIAMRSLPEDALDAFKFAFSQLPQTVIWKYEDDYMPNKPKNVVLYKWLPQRDVLKHPNVRLFINHGGMSGLYEVVDAGVPVLGFPMFFDQPRNIHNLVNLGMALSLKIDDVTRTTVSEALNRLLEDRSFSDNAKRVSSLFHDRPMRPTDSVVYWTEYLIRYGAQANVRPVSADSSWTDHFMIDLFVASMTIVLALWFGVRAIVRKRPSRSKP